VKRAEREAIMRQGVVLPETPRQRRERAGLEEDLHSIELRGKPLPVRPRLFRPRADAYLVASRGPLPYMLRLREIERATEEHEARLRDEWHALARECRDPAEFEARWVTAARSVNFDEVNDLIDRHNRWYPAESRLPMDPRRGDYALVNGRDYRLEPLDARWVPAGAEPGSLVPRSAGAHQRIDRGTLGVGYVAQHALCLHDLQARELVGDLIRREEECRIARAADAVGEV
jgi:hypothetical protein